MRFPKLKKRMITFAGCDIGERRLGVLKSVFDKDEELKKLIKLGYLSAEVEDSRVWLSLTSKGKQHVLPFEKRWSQV